MSKEHFEPVTAKSLAKVILKTMSLGTYYEDHIEAILEPHIRKPSDEDKSVPQRCEEAYDEAVSLLTRTREEVLEIGTVIKIDRFLQKPNPFKEADIVDKEENKTGEPTLLPFDLKAAQEGAKVVTRDGRSAKIVADNITGNYPILAVVTSLDGDTGYASFTIKGNRALSGRDTELDLFILKEPETLEIQIWRDKNDRSYLLTTPNQSGYSKYYEADCELIKTITVTI